MTTLAIVAHCPWGGEWCSEQCHRHHPCSETTLAARQTANGGECTDYKLV